jgi:MarR family transcriptional regulator, transcriptional regulator for hemolysin
MRELEERFSNALHSAARGLRVAMDRRLKSLGVSHASWMAIAAAAKARRPLSQSQLALRLGIEGPTMVATIDRLVKSGLALRESSAADRRIKRVVLTAAGNRLYAELKAEAAALRHEVLAGIDAKRLRVATDLLEGLKATLDARSNLSLLKRSVRGQARPRIGPPEISSLSAPSSVPHRRTR